MRLDKIAEGIYIMSRYYKAEGGGHNMAAEHDEVFLYPADKPMKQEDIDRMLALGWMRDGEDGWRAYV